MLNEILKLERELKKYENIFKNSPFIKEQIYANERIKKLRSLLNK